MQTAIRSEFPEALYIRVSKGTRARLRRAARAHAKQIGVTSKLPAAEFVRIILAQALEHGVKNDG